MEKTYEKFKNAVMWTAGDFNLPDINWNPLSLPPGNNRYKKEINERAIRHTKITFQEQQILEPTRQDSTLDLFLSNRPTLTRKYRILPGLGKSDHDIIHISARISAKLLKRTRRTIWDWNKRNNENLHQDAKNFANLFIQKHNRNNPVEELWTCLKSNIQAIMDENIPTRQTSNSSKQSWITNKAKKL